MDDEDFNGIVDGLKEVIFERMDRDAFFALPDVDPDHEGVWGLGMAGLKTEGACLYQGEGGYYWSLQVGAKGSLWRAMA